MNIETACTVLGISIVPDRAEMIRSAHSAFRSAVRNIHPDRTSHLPVADVQKTQEQYATLAEALAVVKKVFDTPPPRPRPTQTSTCSVGEKNLMCVAKLRLCPEEMAASPEDRSFLVVYEDACAHCVRSGKYRIESSKCLVCHGVGVFRAYSASSEIPASVCSDCLGTGNQFCEIRCPRCNGTRGVKVEVGFGVPAGTPLPLGKRVHEFPVGKDSFYSKGIVRVELMRPEPTPAPQQPQSDKSETI